MYIIQNKETKQYLYKVTPYGNHWTEGMCAAKKYPYRLAAWSVFKDSDKYQLWELIPKKVSYVPLSSNK